MDMLDDTIRFQQKQILCAAKANNGTVIARTGNDATIAVKLGQDFLEKLVFAELTQSHHWTMSGNASAVRVSALKMACIVIETSNDPLHS